jgi:GntR family transcriptional regulator
MGSRQEGVVMTDQIRRTTRKSATSRTPDKPSGEPPIPPPSTPATHAGEPNVFETTIARANGRRSADASLAAATARMPVYQRIADDIRAQIQSGELPEGADLPSEAQMSAHYATSDKTVRVAIGKLRGEGLLETRRGARTKVRATQPFITGDVLAFDPLITRKGKAFHSWDSRDWTPVHEPSQYRDSAGHYHRALAVQPAADVLITRRQLQHSSGVQVIQSVFVPLAVAVTTQLTAPFRPPADLYRAFADAGHELHWRETTACTMPSPDDSATLAIPEGLPLLIHILITLGTDDQPLALEETRLPSHRATIAHRQAT